MFISASYVLCFFTVCLPTLESQLQGMGSFSVLCVAESQGLTVTHIA